MFSFILFMQDKRFVNLLYILSLFCQIFNAFIKNEAAVVELVYNIVTQRKP